MIYTAPPRSPGHRRARREGRQDLQRRARQRVRVRAGSGDRRGVRGHDAAREAQRRRVVRRRRGTGALGLRSTTRPIRRSRIEKIVANLNIDGGNIFGRTSDVAIIGKGKSDLELRLVGRRAEPAPNRGGRARAGQGVLLPLRSAQLRAAGVPALYFKSGRPTSGAPTAGDGTRKPSTGRPATTNRATSSRRSGTSPAWSRTTCSPTGSAGT